jgi:hypothetical protein
MSQNQEREEAQEEVREEARVEGREEAREEAREEEKSIKRRKAYIYKRRLSNSNCQKVHFQLVLSVELVS